MTRHETIMAATPVHPSVRCMTETEYRDAMLKDAARIRYRHTNGYDNPSSDLPERPLPKQRAEAVNASRMARRQAVIDLLKSGPMARHDIMTATGMNKSTLYDTLNILRHEGMVKTTSATKSGNKWYLIGAKQ